jgi:hypothetical protein
MSAYTTNDLIKSVRVRGMFPDASQGSLSPSNILLVASEQLREKIAPIILSVREKYYETFIDYDMVNGQAIYDIPDRAVGGICSIVQYIVNNSINNLSPLDPNCIATTVTGLYPRGFYFENDKVVVYPTPNASTGQVRIRYYQRPSLLVQPLDCGQITAVDQTNGTVTLRTYPSSWASGMLVDFISNKTPYTPYGIDTPIYNISAGNVLTFTALPTNREGKLLAKIGDWVSLAGYTPLPEIMADFFSVLAQATTVALLGAIGDKAGHDEKQKELLEMIKLQVKTITPRDVFGTKKVKSDWRNW